MDYFLFQQLNNLAGRFFGLDKIAIFLARDFQYFLAGGILVWGLIRGIGEIREIGGMRGRIKIIGLVFSAAVVSRYIFGEIIKRVVARPRPFGAHQVNQLIPYSSADVSFPSGHMMFIFALGAAVYCYNKRIGFLVFLSGLLVGLARIFTGLHYPGDILGGMILGTLIGAGFFRVFRIRLGRENQGNRGN